MTTTTHQIDRLTRRHGELEGQINEEMRRPQPDEMRIRRLKNEKLRIKDILAAMRPTRVAADMRAAAE